MKRNFLIVLLLVLIGGGFMYLNSNTEFFKGATTFYDTKEIDSAEESTDHIIDIMFDPLEEKLQSLKTVVMSLRNTKMTDEEKKSYQELQEKYKSLLEEVASRKRILIDFFNMNSIDSIKLKKVGDEYVLCESEELSQVFCQGFKDIGYTPESLQSLFGLEPYEERLYQIKSASPGYMYN